MAQCNNSWKYAFLVLVAILVFMVVYAMSSKWWDRYMFYVNHQDMIDPILDQMEKGVKILKKAGTHRDEIKRRIIISHMPNIPGNQP